MKAEHLHFLWHRPPVHDEPNPSPVCVRAWLERGSYLSRMSFVQPKLMWLPAFESSLESRRLNIACQSAWHTDLLSITRIRDCPKIDRTLYPLAQKSRCFMIESSSGPLLFEARSQKEKKRIVFGLKLTVARLASLLTVQDKRAVSEFFEPAESFKVPGRAPEWAR
jgi:hypothetical protein